VRVDHFLTVGISELTPAQWRELEKKLTFVTKQGDVIICYRRLVTKGTYKLPRGAWNLLPDSIRYDDKRACPPMPKLDFVLTLDDVERDERFKGQAEAVAQMFFNEQGLVIRPPGTGKSMIGLKFAADCETRTLILVHTEDILQQWVRYIEQAIPELKGKVGVIRGKESRIGHITVATVQTLNRTYLSKPKSWWRQFGCVIADEAHHVSAPSWETVLNTIPARYRFGFTASPTRADGMHPTMQFIVGPVIHRTKFTSPVKLTVEPVKTGFKAIYRGPFDWSTLLDTLVTDEDRNRKVAQIADDEIRSGNNILVLSRRIEHLERIAASMSEPCEILTGERSRRDRKRLLGEFRSGGIRCLLSTQLADEALDVPRLNRIVLTHPGKHEGRLIQQVGRALRQHPEKKDAKIYDMVDSRVGVLRRQWDRRKQAYKQNGISVNGRKLWL
jgi:superfamily II DNA or RNA helicase